MPRGDQWGVVQWPADPIRRKKKEAEIARRRERQAARVAAMTPEQLARYRRWHALHKPGGKAARERARRDREAAALLEPRPADVRPATAEAARIAAELERLREAEAVLLTRITAAEAAAKLDTKEDVLA